MSYAYLALAIVGELIGTMSLKYSEGFTKLAPTAITAFCYLGCFFFLAKALKDISLSVAYASWSGLGIVGATLLSLIVFKEQINMWGVVGIGLVVIGVVLLNLFGTAH